MNPVTRARRLSLLVLVAYLAAGTLGMLWHEHVHAHATADVCCHTHDGTTHSHGPGSAPADDQSGPRLLGTSSAHDCFICRVTGQPVVAATPVEVELSEDVAPDPLPCPAAAPRSLAARLAQSRAPPAAAI